MSTQSPRASRSLPERPDLRHLKEQAHDLLKAGEAASVTEAQFQIAQAYGFSSWPRLKSHVDTAAGPMLSPLETAIHSQDVAALQALIADDPQLLQRQGYWAHARRHNRYKPLDYAAAEGKLEAVRTLLAAGAVADERSLRAASYDDDTVPIMELLLDAGADANTVTAADTDRPYPLIFGPCETLAAEMLRLLLDRGAQPQTPHGSALAKVLANNNRNPKAKSACLEALQAAGVTVPDTVPMAVHGSRLDLLRLQAQNDPGLLSRSYSEAEIYPPDLGVELPPVYAYVTPLRGVSLLHMAVEWADLALARWLLDEGADVNAAARTDDDGWGGWTPLFHAMVSLRVPRSQTDLFSLLVERGAQTAVTASIRKPVRREGQIQYVEYRDVTPLAYARGFDETDLVNEAAVQALA